MIKQIRLKNKWDVNLCNDGKPCKYIILIGNNSVGKTYLLDKLSLDFNFNSGCQGLSDFLYTYQINGKDLSSRGWRKPKEMYLNVQCFYIKSISKILQLQNSQSQLTNCKHLEDEIKRLLNIDQVNNCRFKDKKGYVKDACKNNISNFLNSFFGTDKYLLDLYYVDENTQKVTIVKNREMFIGNSSSGELQALAFITYITKFVVNTNSNKLLLIDEPETFMHPKGQINFANSFDIWKSNPNSDDDQYFIATHSPFIIKSFLEKFKNNVKILHFRKIINDDGTMLYQCKSIDKSQYLEWNNISIPEINYLVFQIPSNDYFLELYEYLMKKYMNKNNITEISFSDFDKKYLRTEDSELIQSDKPLANNDGKQTSLTRFRHLIAHGGNIGTEKGYKSYCDNVFNPTQTTKDFYNKYENEYMKLLEEQISKLITCINKFQ